MSQLDSHSVQRSPIICFPEKPVRSIFVSGTDAHTVGVATAGSANLHMQHATYLQHAANVEVQPTVIPQTTIHSQTSSNCQTSSTLQFGLTLNSHTSSNFQIVSAPQPVTNIASLPNIEAKTTCTYSTNRQANLLDLLSAAKRMPMTPRIVDSDDTMVNSSLFPEIVFTPEASEQSASMHVPSDLDSINCSRQLDFEDAFMSVSTPIPKPKGSNARTRWFVQPNLDSESEAAADADTQDGTRTVEPEEADPEEEEAEEEEKSKNTKRVRR